jgi:hypothetical protein
LETAAHGQWWHELCSGVTPANSHHSGVSKEIDMGKKQIDKKLPEKKLVLKRETLAVLDPDQLSQVVGGQNLCHKKFTSW